MNKQLLKEKYTADLLQNFLPFWENAIDSEYGGVFTCFTNEGDKLVSDKKYIWSQGRFLWLCCHLLILKKKGLLDISERWEEAATKTYQFLEKNAVMKNNHIVYAVERDGTQIDEALDISIFADCFYIIGCNAYAYYYQDKDIFNKTIMIYDKVKQRISQNDFASEPYPIPTGFETHSIPMILLNVAEELYKTAKSLDHPNQTKLLQDMKHNLESILALQDGNRIMEYKSTRMDETTSLLVRHVNPGHTLESVWFMMHSLELMQIENKEEYIDRLVKIAAHSFDIGWDSTYGGLLRFVDKEGGPPKGNTIDTSIEKLITETWDTKLWWPHSEALYTTLLMAIKTKEKSWVERYKKVEEYVFQTFPNENKAIGEWIQIRNRNGIPIQKVVALPVKDPFHIIRNYLLILKLLEE
ncbi:AGE family epimerase/isomerase [Pseudogracilibacillus sp. SE30717A]|uniref:AGE family epimerase/isomerase n=1 Tax=Pseudogracilibacillus sp. SE30717A TaxID=3098293 RepID=UPI00300E5045